MNESEKSQGVITKGTSNKTAAIYVLSLTFASFTYAS